jgi:hypothetical protein
MHSGNAHQRLRWRVLAVAVAIAALAAACGGGGSEPGPVPTARPSTSQPPTVATSSSTPTPTFVNTTPGEQPPVRPADELSDAGVKAFAEYWVKTLDWAYATMDTTRLSAASAADCSVCQSFIESTQNSALAGEIFLGSRLVILAATVVPSAMNSPTRVVAVVLAYTALSIGHPDGIIESNAPAQAAVQLNLTTEFSDSWRVGKVVRVVAQ